MKKFVLPLAVVALTLAVVLAGTAAAQETVSVPGTIVGDRGGAHMEWNVPVPANTDAMVSVTYAPCAPPGTVSLMVYSSDGQVTRAYQEGHCTKSAYWNTGSSETALVKLSYYEPGVALNYVITADGITLTGAEMPMAEEEMAEEEMAEEPMAEEEVTAEETEAEGEMAVEEEAATEETESVAETVVETVEGVASAVGTMKANAVEGTLLGTVGGAHMKYEVDLTGGQEYEGLMRYSMDAGGNWPAVGFIVWGPDGSVVTRSKSMYSLPATANFVAPMDGTYTVDVYNYHPGRTMAYTLTGMPVTAPMAEEGM